MADDAFALSPITARAAQPDDADYEAIRDAFMETARGRWFLGEYAKRNRNADTRMVLDQVARIERMLATQPQPAPDDRVAEILAAITSVVDQATDVADAAASGLAINDRLAPIRKGARILKEISWRWREIGTDARICDSIDSQVDAIEESCRQLASIDMRGAVMAVAAFERMRRRIEALAEENGLAVAPTAEAAAAAAAKLYATATDLQVASEHDILPSGMMPAAHAAAHQPYVTDVTARADPSPHPQLDGAPSAAECLEPRRRPDTETAAAIRRMSLTDKIAFFA